MVEISTHMNQQNVKVDLHHVPAMRCGLGKWKRNYFFHLTDELVKEEIWQNCDTNFWADDQNGKSHKPDIRRKYTLKEFWEESKQSCI